MTFYSSDEVKIAYNEKQVDLHAMIKIRVTDTKWENFFSRYNYW